MLDDRTMELLAEGVAATGDYKVLRRLDLEADPCPANDNADTCIGCVCDVESTGVDPTRHTVIELALRRFRYDRDGAITKLDRPYSWLQDPGEPLDPAIVAITGLTDAQLAGQAIDDARASTLLRSADLRIAHNAAFDRRFVERRLPCVSGLPWACSLREVDWRSRGFDGSGRSLPWLLAQAGYFHGAHRAGADVDATIAILRTRKDGVSALAELVATASRPTWRFAAVGAHFDAKDRLKARGYAWDGEERVWWREVPDHAREGEAAWLAVEVYAPEHRPRLDAPAVACVDWCIRHG